MNKMNGMDRMDRMNAENKSDNKRDESKGLELIDSRSVCIIKRHGYAIVYLNLYKNKHENSYELYMKMGNKISFLAKMNDLDRIRKYMEYKIDHICTINYNY